jgi:protein gp37
MSGDSKIEWTDATWNPTTGCDRVSPGCDHCYAMTLAPRLKAMGSAHYQRDGDPKTSGPGFGVSVHPDALDWPLCKKKSMRIFVNSMSDLFHDEVPDDFIARVFAVMSMAKQHTFQVLTKRHGRMRSLLSSGLFKLMVDGERLQRGVSVLPDSRRADGTYAWPLSNVWLGVSVENQQWADIRIPALLGTPAAVRFLSCEPLLGPVDIARYIDPERECNCHVPAMDGAGQHSAACRCLTQPEISWVIVGGESGKGARPMHPDWARSLRDQCTTAGIPFHFKQWGSHDEHGMPMHKKAAGRELDGRTWDEFPSMSPLSSRRRADAGRPSSSTRASETAAGQGTPA